MRTINLDEWELFGGGGEGDSYYHKTDKTIMLKLYKANALSDKTINDFNNSKELIKLGFNTPKAIERVTDGERNGVIFERLPNKISMSKVMLYHPEMTEKCAVLMAKTLRKIHALHDTNKIFPLKNEGVKHVLGYGLKLQMINQKQYDDLMVKVCEYDNEDNMVMMDPNPGNLVFAGELQENGLPALTEENLYIIDVGGFGRSTPLFDVAQLYANRTGLINPKIIEETSHLKFDIFSHFYELVEKEYFQTDNLDYIHAQEEKSKAFAVFIMIGISLFMHIDCSNEIKKILG